MKQAALIICVILLFPILARATEVRAFVDKTQTTLDDTVRFTVTIKGGGGDVDVSPIKDFQVISRGTGSSVRIVNGNFSRETSYNYTLLPLREGRLQIPPLTVTVKGDKFQTTEIIVYVSKTVQKKSAPRDIFVEAYVSEKNPYVGQPIRYTLKFYHTVQVENAKIEHEPSFSGFTFNKTGDNKSYRTVISGRNFEVTEVTYILTPTTSGRQDIEPAVLACDVVQQRRRRKTNPFDSFFDDSFFNDPFFGRAELNPGIFKTDPVTVNVKPLPPDSGQERFSGLVGRFNVQGTLENEVITAGDSTTLSITIEGTGNIMDASAPEVKLPESFKVYQDTPEEDVHIGADGYSGKKVFRYALVGVKKGDYSIPPVHIRYFDTASNTYRTVSTSPFLLTVHPSKQGNTLEMVSSQKKTFGSHKTMKKKVVFTGRDILPLKDGSGALKNGRALPLFRFVLYNLIPVLLFFGVKIMLIFLKKNDTPATLMAQKAQQSLKKADGTTSDEIFLSSLYRALVYAIFAKSGSRGESLTYAEAEKLLSENGISTETAAEAAALLKKIESAKYSGITMEQHIKKELLSKTGQMVRRLC